MLYNRLKNCDGIPCPKLFKYRFFYQFKNSKRVYHYDLITFNNMNLTELFGYWLDLCIDCPISLACSGNLAYYNAKLKKICQFDYFEKKYKNV